MRFVTINPPVYSTSADLRLKIAADVDVESVARRVTRTATLDGGAVLSDTGYSSGDRTFDLVFPKISQADSETLQTWVKTYATLIVGTSQSVYQGAPESYRYANGDGQLRMLITTDLVND